MTADSACIRFTYPEHPAFELRAELRIDPATGRPRLRGVLRPKADGGGAVFYSVVSRDTLDTEYAAHRQRFLAEQGYAYRIVDADELLGPSLPGDAIDAG